jgi:hypothetical protein
VLDERDRAKAIDVAATGFFGSTRVDAVIGDRSMHLGSGCTKASLQQGFA